MKRDKYELLIFDLDGTIIESRWDIADSVNFIRQEYKLPVLDIDVIAGYIGDGINLLIGRSLGTEDPVEIEKGISLFRDHYWEHCMDKTFLYPGVESTLEIFKKNKKMAIASNKREDFTRKLIEAYGLS